MPDVSIILAGVLAFFCEYIDCSLGMGYGTILSPVLLIMGFEPLQVVPAILFSQAMGGFTASLFHQKLGNVNFGRRTQDSIIFYIITIFGVAVTVGAVFLAVNLSKLVVKTYIGVLVLVIGVIMLSGLTFTFRFRKMIALGIISAFNKGMSGGGFGPIVTGGQIISGQNHKNAVGVTTLAEAPICIAGFLTYWILKGSIDWQLLVAVTIGSVISAPLGAYTTKIMSGKHIKLLLGILVTALGVWTLVKTWLL